VSKKSLKECQMSEAAYVEQAVIWSKELTRMRTRGPGDLENAMRGIERDYGVDYWTLWQLRYRANRIKDIGVSIYMRLESAYQAERARQRRLYEGDQENTQVTGRIAASLVSAADALAGTEDGAD
jgi:hypothetical protein